MFGVPQGLILTFLLFNIPFCDPFFIMKETNFESHVDDNTPYVPTKNFDYHNLISCCSGFQIIKRS